MTAYHGSKVVGLETLMPFASPHNNLREPCVYLSTNNALAALYIWNKPYMWLTFEFDERGRPVYVESFKDSLGYFYEGVSGSVYTCEGDFERVASVGISAAVISRRPVRDLLEERVEDTLDLLLRHEREGSLDILRYETLSPERHEANRRMVMGAIKRLELLKGEHPMAGFVSSVFPELWEEALSEAIDNRV